ncbi:MAG: glucans biosynthesis glucosyltransferase MdoH [Hyphomicrobiales bacterium]|nr:glucans biosynthesis glucosyltransferase MdoH [Hyphomicrobiales bacterium]
MNDQTPLRLEQVPPRSGRLTPAGFQENGILFRRRLIMATLSIGTIIGLLYVLGIVLGSDGWTLLDMGIFASFAMSAPWTVMGFWNAVIGFTLLHFSRNHVAEVSPYALTSSESAPLVMRSAILMTLRNEDPARAFHRLRIMRESLQRTGEVDKFDFFVLSDSDVPAIAEREESLFAAWEAEFSDRSRTFYRRRERNDGYKAGNVRDFVTRWGSAYDLMLTLDADSLMSGEEIVRLARIMQAHPKLGILQTLCTGTPSESAFGRVFQFGMRHGMRSYTMGNAWWNADCGPFWGHNAVIRVAPFEKYCELPKLPGKPPLGGWILSHDQVEATLMRAGGYEVRVLPVEVESWEDNPPTLLDFTKRDLRWCQGNMQYWRLVFGLRGLLPLSRFHIAMGIGMYLAAFAWTLMITFSALKVFDPAIGTAQISLGIGLFFFSFLLSIAPKLIGMLDVVATRGGVASYGGGLRFFSSALTEIMFSILMAPIMAVRLTIFMVSLAFGRSVMWSGQQRDAHGLSWSTAFSGLWPQTLFGLAILGLFLWKAPGVLPWAAPLLSGLIFSVPFAVITASPRFGRFLSRIGLCAIPEEISAPIELKQLTDSSQMEPAGADDDLPASRQSGQFAAVTS